MLRQFKVEQIENDQRNLMLLLQQLNGGNEVIINQPDYYENLILVASDSIWESKQLLDPSLKILSQQEEVV